MDRQRGHLTKNIEDASSALTWIKVVGIGDPCVGKTCLIKHFCESKFNVGYQPTVGVDYGFKIQSVSGRELRVHLWDLSGSAEYLDVRNELYTNTDAVFLVYDVTNHASFEGLDTWLRELAKFGSGSPEIAIVANKSDLRSKRVVQMTEGKQWAASHKLRYFETSCGNGDGVESMFDELLSSVIQRKSSGRKSSLKAYMPS